MNITPTTSVTLTNADDSTKSLTFEVGVHIDGNRMAVEDGTIELVRFANGVLDRLGIAREIVEPIMSDDPDSFDDFAAASDECESALNDVTPQGWYWHWTEGDFWLSPPDERVAFSVERYDADAIVEAEGDGEFSAQAVGGVWAITVHEVDEDGDFGDALGTFAAIWAGGQAPYVNVYSSFFEAGRDIGLPTDSYTIAGPTEALHIGDPAESRSAQIAEKRLAEWLQEYADGVDVDWHHDASHYGLPS